MKGQVGLSGYKIDRKSKSLCNACFVWLVCAYLFFSKRPTPDIAGHGLANPLATILSVAMMLRYTFAQEDAALRIESAVRKVLALGYRTADIYEPGT